jgi:hypothetical protein
MLASALGSALDGKEHPKMKRAGDLMPDGSL